MDAVKRKLLLMVVEILMARLTAPNLKKWLCSGIDFGRKQIIESENKLDDYALPVFDAAEQAFCADDPMK